MPHLLARTPDLLAERLMQPARVFGRELAAEHLGFEVADAGGEPARGRVAAQHEQRGGPGDDDVTDVLDEVVGEAEARQAPAERAGRRAERRAGERNEEQEPEQHAPEAAPEGAGAPQGAE